MDIRYQEFNPSAALQPYVDRYWSMSFDGPGSNYSPEQHCLPLGMLELIFHLDENPYEVCINGVTSMLPRCFIAGMYEMPVSWKAIGGSRLFGIRIKPECMMEIFKVPVSLLFNEFIDMDTFFGGSIRPFGEQIREAKTLGERINLAEHFLLTRLLERRAERNYVTEAARLIRRQQGNISLEDLSSQLYISPRQLQRSFKDSMGTSPKTYMRIIRFRNAYDQVQQSKGGVSWAGLSYQFGYSDQAHFIRDFKQFAGQAPTLLVQNRESFYQLSGAPELTVC